MFMPGARKAGSSIPAQATARNEVRIWLWLPGFRQAVKVPERGL